MATREKKLSVSRKQSISSPLPKEDVTNEEVTNPASEDATKPSPPKPSLAKKLGNKNPPKKLIKKTAIRKLKPVQKKLKHKMIAAMMTTTKRVEKKKLLKVKTVRPRKLKLLKKSEENLLPSVLEPILLIDEEAETNKVTSSDIEALTIDPAKTKRVYKRKPKVVVDTISETIDDVIKDLTALIKDEPDTEPVKSETPKPKKVIRKRKKENIENTLKLTLSQRKVIDMLDLNVNKLKDLPTVKRRHSIEKIPSSVEPHSPTINRLVAFNQLPRSISPRLKLLPKLRRSYKTRSNSPARILRNGKQTKPKDSDLLEGLDGAKRRRRNYSEFSGSEISKLSGYESDSTFSDLSSIHGTENCDQKDLEIKKEIFSEIPTIKRSLSSESEINGHGTNNLTDTNSNFCLNKENATSSTEVKKEIDEMMVVSPSSKVPEKSIILDIMKQTFNDSLEEKETKKYVKPKICRRKSETLCETTAEIKIEQETPEKDNCPSEDLPEIETENSNLNESEESNSQNGDHNGLIEESPEDLAIKENILQALGLQSSKAAKEARLKTQEKLEQKNYYTGTLKTVIRLNRGDKRKGKNSMKITLQKNGGDDSYKMGKDGSSTSWKQGSQSSDTAGAQRKSHYSNRSNMDGSAELSESEMEGQEGTKSLVIPEKASSFSIHPGRTCKDECSYCFGKFGLFDTPCHIAQMKSVDRQNKILAAEKLLTRDSCLCDACYRHVDRKSNTPSYVNRSFKRNTIVAPGPRQDHCHVLGCGQLATNILRRKWIIKMRKSICEVINIDLDNPGLHSIPICDQHYSALEYLMVCAMCKRRLAKNHVHYLGPETTELNSALDLEGIPIGLSDKPVVCKLCKFFASIILKAPEERPENSSSFFTEYKKRLLHFNNIVPMDEAAAEEPIVIPTKDTKIEKEQVKKKRKLLKNPVSLENKTDLQVDVEKADQTRVPSNESANQSRPESPSDYMIDYKNLIPSIAMDCGSDSEAKKDHPKQLKLLRPETVKQAVEISKTMKVKNDKSSDIAVQRLGSNPSISVRQLFPCEEDLPLQGNIEFGNVKERTPEGWEKCTSVIQYDMETKMLWQELQKPYGNQSSFLRHLILLEKYFRNGDLVLANSASHHSINYSESVHNRLRAYDNIPSASGNVQPLSMIPFNKPQKSSNIVKPIEETPSVVPKNTPITISQLNSPPLIPPPTQSVVQNPKPKSIGAPPGLISLQPGTSKPIAPITKPPQSQKIKFPITKNWRPNLIPIDPTQKNTERKAGLVQVISGGNPYHITLEDYKKMCAIKKSFEMKQKRIQEAKAAKAVKLAYNPVWKNVVPRKNLVISKTSPKRESESESILEKLDKQIEKLETRLIEKTPLAIPKIPKSLTVIPQTVPRKPSRPSSPVLLITPKPKQITNKS